MGFLGNVKVVWATTRHSSTHLGFYSGAAGRDEIPESAYRQERMAGPLQDVALRQSVGNLILQEGKWSKEPDERRQEK